MEHTGDRIGFMQDNAQCHEAALTTGFLRARGVESIIWPAFSPDLNPIKAVWSLMKTSTQTNYPEFDRGSQGSRNEVCEIVQEAWDVIILDRLYGLIVSMLARCQVVIDADKRPVRYQ